MLLKLLLVGVAVSTAWASQCGVPTVPLATSRMDTLIARLTGQSNDRIVGGIEAAPHSHPWQVALLSREGNPTAFCGGSLIDNEYILTAAHCVFRTSTGITFTMIKPADVKVRVGVHDLRSKLEPYAKTIAVAEIIVHPSYNPGLDPFDFVLLKLAEPVVYSAHASPVCLADSSDGPVGQKCYVTGFGRTNSPTGTIFDVPNISSVVRQVDVNILEQAQCQKAYSALKYDITPDQICAAAPAKDSCNGDSGGPLVCQQTPGAPFKLVGLVSWGVGCADPRYPGVYGRTSIALNWIAGVLSK